MTDAIIPAKDLHADIDANGVSIHMDGDRDAELFIEGPFSAVEVHDGMVYKLTFRGSESGVSTSGSCFVPAGQLFEAIVGDPRE